MPFRSEAQRRYLWANEPEVARRWQKKTPKDARLPERVGKIVTARALKAKMRKPLTGGITREEAKRAAKALGLDFAKLPFTFGAFLEGMNVEREHADVAKTARDIAKIAIAHLRERADYYERLRSVEHGKFSVTLSRYDNGGAQGDAPRQAIPDYQSIYFQPEAQRRDAQTERAAKNRRRAASAMNGPKFGFHGRSAMQDEPILRYESERESVHGPRVAQRAPIVRAKKLGR